MDVPSNQFIASGRDFRAARIALFGAPYDSTCSYRPGTRSGPDAVRRESYGIETYSPLQDADLEDVSFFDCGDLELPFGAPEKPLEAIESRASEILDAGKMPYLVGGEHLVTLGAVRAALTRHPGLKIVHFDAHADLRDDYLGNRLSHATVMRRCLELLKGDGVKLWQFGIRSGTREEFAMKENRGICREPFSAEGAKSLSVQDPVYLSVDMDVLDPSEFPGTGTPEAGGVRYAALLDAVLSVIRNCNVVAMDMVELSPPLDPTGRSTALACKYLRETILAACAADEMRSARK